MFICDLSKREVTFFDGKKIKRLTADFDLLYSKIQKSYPRLSNVFTGKGDLTINTSQLSFFYSFLYEKWFSLSGELVESLGIQRVLQYFYGYSIEEFVQIQVLWQVEVYWILDWSLSFQKISSEKDLVAKSFFVDWYFDEAEQLHIAYARFPLIWGNYTKTAHIDNSSIGVDWDRDVAYQKALSEAIERVSASLQVLEERRFDALTLANQDLLLKYLKYQKSDVLLGNGYSTYDGLKTCFLPEYITYYPTIGHYHYDSNSNGMATHISLQKAQESAVLELVERDAFLFSRLTRSSWVKKIDLSTVQEMGIQISDAGFRFDFFLLESFVPLPTVLMIMSQDGKSSISLATDFELKTAIKKAYQEGINSKPIFEKDFSENLKGIMGHIAYYLNPQNQRKLDWIFQSESLLLSDLSFQIKNFDELLMRFEGQGIDIYFYRYENALNMLFERYTVRVYSEIFLPMYFGNTIPHYVQNHQRLQGRVLNQDKHPLG